MDFTKGQAYCAEHELYYFEDRACYYCAGESKPGEWVGIAELLDAERAAHHRGAFRALADVGCAVQLGLLAVFASRMLPAVYAPWDGPESPVRTHALAIGYSLLAGLGGRP